MIRRVLICAVLAALLIAMTMPALAQDAAGTYKKRCSMCHGADGKGNPVMADSMRHLDLVTGTKGKSEAEIATVIAKGRRRMKAYADLGEPMVQALAKYVKGLK